MLIREIKLYVRKRGLAKRSVAGRGGIEKVPPGVTGLFTHDQGIGASSPEGLTEYTDDRPTQEYELILRLVTDGELDAFSTYSVGFSSQELEWEGRHFKATIAHLLIDVDVFDREYIWQRLWYAQRFFYTGRRVVDTVDNMLWDLASRHARVPIYKLIGAQRERIPAYRNIGGKTIDDLVANAVLAKEQGYKGVKDHSYRGVKGNIELARALRSTLGDDFLLFHDPVESYTCDEAIRIGRELERLNYQWIEEPLQDYDLLGLKKLCKTLDVPVLALEWIGAIGGQPYNASAYLALGATDIVRQRGVGITGQLKLAHLAEGFGVPIHGGNPHVILAIRNDPIFEMGSIGPCDPSDDPESLTFQGIPVVENGYLTIMCGDQPAPEPDWDAMEQDAEVVI